MSKFETTTWQLLACVLTQLAIDLVAAERKTREVWVESQTDPSFPHFFTPPIPSCSVLLTEGLEQATIWISVWDFSDLGPPLPPGKKGIKKRLRVDQFHDRHFVRQGSKGSSKPGKPCNFILTFSRTRKSWKKKTTGPGKKQIWAWKNPWNLFLKRGTNPVGPSDFFQFFFSSFSVFFPSLYKFKKCLVHKRVKKIRCCN